MARQAVPRRAFRPLASIVGPQGSFAEREVFAVLKHPSFWSWSLMPEWSCFNAAADVVAGATFFRARFYFVPFLFCTFF